MITIRFLGNAMSLPVRYEVLRDGKIIGAVFIPGITMCDLGAGDRAYTIAIRDFS